MGIWRKLKRALGGGAEEERAPASPEDAFTEMVIEALEGIDYVARAERDPDQAFTVRVRFVGDEDAKEPAALYLGNVFAESRDLSPEEKVARVIAPLAALRDPGPSSWEECRELLVPLVRGVTYAAQQRELVARPFVPFLKHCIGLDLGASTRFVTEADREAWAVTDEEIFEAARLVLENHVEPEDVESWDPTAAYPIWHVARDDSYESSRLLLPGFLASFRGRVNGNPIAIVPHRSLLIVAGDGDAAAVGRLLDTAENEFNASPRSVSTAIYTADDADNVVLWEPPADHPHANKVKRQQLLVASAEYGAQKSTLEKELEDEGRDIFVASYSIITNKETGRVASFAVWTEGVDTMLPETDLVALVGGDPDESDRWHFMVPWNIVRRLARKPCLRRVKGTEPPRWRTIAWPDEDLLRKLKKKAIEL